MNDKALLNDSESMASTAAARRQAGKREQNTFHMLGRERKTRNTASAPSKFCIEMQTSIITREKQA